MDREERLAGPRALTFALVGGACCWALIALAVRAALRQLG